jgi:hypothetical protein
VFLAGTWEYLEVGSRCEMGNRLENELTLLIKRLFRNNFKLFKKLLFYLFGNFYHTKIVYGFLKI